jgi:pimeloyl-ACP methyl ester carboxylesterase
MVNKALSQNQHVTTIHNQINHKMKQSQTPIIAFSPVVLPVPGRHVDLEMKVTAPANGNNLPVIILSHGHGASNFLSSYRGYSPLVDFFASHGFVVIQPTHQDSKTLTLDPSIPEAPLFWNSRAEDMKYILDHLDNIISTVPGLSGRVDKTNVAAIGHSMGGHTVAMLAGMEVTDPATGKIVNAAESRLKARVLIGVSGGPEGFNGAARQRYGVLAAVNFSTMTLPALIVNGDKDINLMFSNVDNWRADAYYQSPGAKDLLTVFEAEHIFGGISGYDALETSDENPERVTFVCETILAYLQSALNPTDRSWEEAKKALNGVPGAKGRIDSKL